MLRRLAATTYYPLVSHDAAERVLPPYVGRSNARGFSLVELIVTLAIVTIVAWALLHVLSQALLASRMQARDDVEQSTIGQLVDTLTSEQDDAWAIYTPPADVLGKSNSDGHEVDFFARDGKQRPYFWAYGYDKTAQTLTRYRFSSPGGIAIQDTTYTGITKFAAQTYPLTALQDASTPIYSSLYNGAALQSGIVHFYPSMPWIAGGNNITYVHIEGAPMKQDLQLATNTAPSGFTVVVYYTPSPSPSPTSAPFKTWPANLVLGANGGAVGTSSGALASTGTMGVAFSQLLNRALGGSVALAATAGQACYAIAENAGGTGPDTTLPSGAPVQVDSNGCELDSSGNALTQPVIFMYEPSGTSETFDITNNPCASGGSAQVGPWNPYSATGANVLLDVTGKAAGTCSVTFGDGQSTQTPSADAGLVAVGVAEFASTKAVDAIDTYTPCAHSSSSTGWCSSGSSSTTVMTYYESTGSGWAQVGSKTTNSPPGYNGGNSSSGFTPSSFTYTCSGTARANVKVSGTWSPSVPPNDTPAMDSTCYYYWQKIFNG